MTEIQRQPFVPEDVHSNADGWWRDCAERAVMWCAAAGFPFSADTLTELGVPDPDVPQRWGSLLSTFHRRGLIELVGFKTSPRQSRQGGVVRVWRGTPAAREVDR
ncbi:MAG: hypothetical protein CVT65_13960 [Actinobacteria bacterium HGW-Actinobacteria-5]|nr:MAG: hypothetical protein CVT65_13960 [Actinobacteria bacterium HGW-Actinobacteria-5]